MLLCIVMLKRAVVLICAARSSRLIWLCWLAAILVLRLVLILLIRHVLVVMCMTRCWLRSLRLQLMAVKSCRREASRRLRGSLFVNPFVCCLRHLL